MHVYLNVTNWHLFRITSERFTELARLIAVLFKKENPYTYYSPYVAVNKLRTGPSGTLYEHYRYLKNTLRKSGILSPSNRNNADPVYEPCGKNKISSFNINVI